MASILRLKDIGKVWHIERTQEQVVALGSISMDVEQGEFLVFVGPSGCGKSTLLQIIAGLEKPESGTVDLSRSADGQKQTGMVFQEFALFPWRTVMENIVFGPEVRSVPRAQREANAQKLIELVHLRGFEHRYPHELSGGMRQRVALARALANDPWFFLQLDRDASRKSCRCDCQGHGVSRDAPRPTCSNTFRNRFGKK